jgi:ABC-type Zn2+ transport system substrate-binding protein/surface adhesin
MTDPRATEEQGLGDVPGDHHDASDHGEAHDHDDHAHADEALGPIDVAAWSAGVLGIAIAVVIAACLVLATSGIG